MKKNAKEVDSQSLNNILGRLRLEYWKNLSDTQEQEKQEGVELLTFWLADEHYGVDLSLSRHLLKLPKIVKLPQVNPYIMGVFNLRGDIVPAIDLRKMFGLKETAVSEDSRLLVVEAKSIMVALFLDRIGDIIFAEKKKLQAVAPDKTAIPTQFLKGYFLSEDQKGKMLIYLDLEQLLTSQQLAEGLR
jgi:purine-binding chemotaxis protein CheW